VINFVCICKIEPDNYKRPVYNKMWVDRLYSAVKRSVTSNFTFTCLSSDLKQSECNYNVVPFLQESWGWWNKLEIFRKGLFNGPCIYLDLDLVFCKDITKDLQSLPDNLMLMPIEPYKNILNSSLIYWNGDYEFLYSDYLKDKENIEQRYQYPSEDQPSIGDEAWIVTHIPDRVDAFDNYVREGFFNWCHHKVETQISDPSILIFTGEQKPSNNQQLQLVKDNWID
jgi:hypothetical protein